MKFMEPCNSFDEENKVIIGHDYGHAVWVQVVKVTDTDKILDDDIAPVGEEISVEKCFFDSVCKDYFLEVFDAEMSENKHRYTYAFSDEGRYLTRFEEEILEPNFFTYEQIEQIIERMGGEPKLLTFTRYMKSIMAHNSDEKLVSVMS